MDKAAAVLTVALPVLPASTGIVLVSRARLKAPPVPSNSRPAAARFCVCVTVPVVDKVVLPLVVTPTVLRVPITKPLFSRKLSTPVLAARVVMALATLLKM